MDRQPTMFRTPSGRTYHLLDATTEDRRTTLCGQPATVGARFNTSDLPSGERTTKVCSRCRAAVHA